MSEFLSYVPVIALAVSFISAIIGILTYRRVSKKVFSKGIDFNIQVEANENKTIATIDGKGLFEKLEISGEGEGCKDSKLVIAIDNEKCINDTFNYFLNNAPQYFKQISFTKESFTLIIDLPKIFYKNCTVSVENNSVRTITVKGTLHFKIS